MTKRTAANTTRISILMLLHTKFSTFVSIGANVWIQKSGNFKNIDNELNNSKLNLKENFV